MTKVLSKMTLRPRAATPVNRSRSLAQVWPLSQFSGLKLRNRDGAGLWEKDSDAPEQKDTLTSPAPSNRTSGSVSVTTRRAVGPSEGSRFPERVSLTLT